MPLPSACPLCAAGIDRQVVATRHVYGGRKGQAYIRCEDCDTTYLHPQLSAEEQAEFYASEFEPFMARRSSNIVDYSGPEQHIAAHEDQRVRRQRFLEPYLPNPPGRILEIGCSSGFMLWPLQDDGHQLFGIEPSSMFLDYLNERGVKSWASTEELLKTEEADLGFDLIMHFFVLEHVADPTAFIRQQVNLLKPGGSLVIEAPNANDALATIYEVPEFERFYWTVMHNWYFTEAAFTWFLGQFDMPFKIELDQRYDLSNHMVWARDGKPGGFGRFTELFGKDIEDQYRAALIESGHCDTLFGIITRPE